MSIARLSLRPLPKALVCPYKRQYASESTTEPAEAKAEAANPTENIEDAAAFEPPPEPTGREVELSRSVWLAQVGERYRRPLGKGRINWISSVPFPLNPSFLPRPPLSNNQRNRIFGAVQAALGKEDAPPESVVLREIAQKNGISIERLKAIVKLKVIEQGWLEKERALQMNFNRGMEDALGVRASSQAPNDDVQELASSRRQVFEMVELAESGKEDAQPPIIKKKLAKLREEHLKRMAEKEAGSGQGQSRFKTPATRPKGPQWKVSDVTGTTTARDWAHKSRASNKSILK